MEYITYYSLDITRQGILWRINNGVALEHVVKIERIGKSYVGKGEGGGIGVDKYFVQSSLFIVQSLYLWCIIIKNITNETVYCNNE